MFDSGAKVVLLTSTSDEKYSPRRGSVGYIKWSGQNFMVHRFLNRTVAMTRSDLLLMRYGFGKERIRPERHMVITHIPFFPKAIPGLVSDEIDAYMEEFHRERKNPKLDYFRAKLNVIGPMPIVIAAPPAITDFNVMSLDEANFRAWFEAIISSPQLKRALSQMNIDRVKKYDNNILGHILSLKALNTTKKNKQNFINTISSDSQIKKQIIEALRPVLVTSLTRGALEHKRYLSNGFKIKKYYSKDVINAERMLKDMSKNFFREDVFEHSKQLIHDHCHGKQDAFIRCVDMTRTALKKKATKLFNIKNKSQRPEFLQPVK